MAFTLKTGDTSPAIADQLQDHAGTAIDITGATVRFLMRQPHAETLTVDAPATITDAANGVVEYQWAAGDTAEPGRYHAEWEVSFTDGTVETFPNSGYIIVYISDDLDTV